MGGGRRRGPLRAGPERALTAASAAVSTPVRYVLVWAAAFGAFTLALSGGFALDDSTYILRNAVLGSPREWPRFFYDPTSVVASPTMAVHAYRPLVGLCYGLTTLLGGLNPFWFHLVSASLHATNACLVWALARRWFPGLPALAAAALFALHPVQAEAVAYIGAQPDLLVLFFCLAAFLAYTHPRFESSLAVRGSSWGAFAAGLLAKENALFLLLAIPAYDHVKRPGPWRRRLAWWLPYALIGAAYMVVRGVVLGRLSHEGRPWGGSWLLHLMLAAHGVFQDLANVLWPLHLRVCYAFEIGPGFAWLALIKAAVLAGVAAACLAGLRRRRAWAFGAAWAIAALLPVSNILPLIVLAADRFLYVPMAGLALAWAQWVARWPRRWAAGAVAALSAGLLGLSLDQQLAWQNDVALYTHAYSQAPRDPCTHVYLATYYLEWGMLEKAEAMNEAVLRSPMLRARGLRTLGAIRMAQRRLPEARQALEAAVAENPRAVGGHAALAQCLEAEGDHEGARRERALEAELRRSRAARLARSRFLL